MKLIKPILLVLVCLLSLSIQAQSVVFNRVYNNYNHLFFYDSATLLYNNESIHSFTETNGGYLISGNSFTNYSFTNDSARMSFFNMKIDLWGDTIWQRKDDLSISGREGIGYYFEYPNKELISVGTISDYYSSNFQFKDALVYKTDSLGKELWRKRHNFGDDSNFASVPYTKDSGQTFQLVGFADVDTSGINYDAFISTIDSSGNLISNIQLGGLDDDFLYALEYLDNGNYLVCGYTYSFGVTGSDIWLMEVDINGTVIWQKNYGDIYFERIQNSRSMLIKDNYIYIAGGGVGTYNNNGTPENTTAGWFLKLDMQGNVIWDKKYIRGEGIDYFYNISEWDEESFIIGGIIESYNNTQDYPTGWLLKVDTSGNVIWERSIAKYKDQTNLVHHYPADMLVTQDKGILIGGYVIANEVIDFNGYFHRNDAWLAKTDSCGYTVGDVPIPFFVVDSIQKSMVYLTEESKRYCTGIIDWGDGTEENYYAYANNKPLEDKPFSHSYSEIGTYTIKITTLAGEEYRSYELDITINDLGVGIKTIDDEQFAISLFPNPANDYVIIQNPYSSHVIPAQAGISTTQILNQVQNDGGFKMTISNLNGKQVKSINLNPKLYQQKVAVSALNNGVYFVRFEVEGVLIGMEKLVVAK